MLLAARSELGCVGKQTPAHVRPNKENIGGFLWVLDSCCPSPTVARSSVSSFSLLPSFYPSLLFPPSLSLPPHLSPSLTSLLPLRLTSHRPTSLTSLPLSRYTYRLPRCISRQLWWGHRIPAYFATVEGEKTLDQVGHGAVRCCKGTVCVIHHRGPGVSIDGRVEVKC